MTFLYQAGLFSGSQLGAYIPSLSRALKEDIRYRVKLLNFMHNLLLSQDHSLSYENES
jgi:hypothetical protein